MEKGVEVKGPAWTQVARQGARQKCKNGVFLGRGGANPPREAVKMKMGKVTGREGGNLVCRGGEGDAGRTWGRTPGP